MMTDTSGARSRRSESNPADAIGGLPSSFIIFGVRGCAPRAHRQERSQISPVGLGRRRLIVDDSRETSARVVGTALLDQDAAEMAQHLDPRAPKSVDETVGGRAVARAHQFDK